MFEKAVEKVKNWFNDPNWAPVTQPLKTIGGGAYVPLGALVECVKDGLDKDSYSDDSKKPAFVRIYKEFGDLDHIGVMLGTWGAGILGALFAAFAGGSLALGAGAGFALTTAATVAALGVGFVAAPVAVFGALAFAGATVGALFSPVSAVKGLFERHKYKETLKAQGAVAQAVPALQAQSADVKQTAVEILATLSNLPADVRGPVMRVLNDRYAEKGGREEERILQALDAMPPDARTSLLKGLKDRLAPEFAAVAEREAGDSVVLQKGITVDGPLKLKIPGAARA